MIEQLAEGGRMVVPVASGAEEMLTLLRRRGSEIESTAIAPCRFVPLIGAEGF
jgi:protein-L-isoaspartate(D-aspartate) O-methyltransferase